ncbi:MAG: hypothetical protein JW751_28855 [Polyangiaceae bacterium]|nr:hypothetical protein [Polyangiaceae bacterium]
MSSGSDRTSQRPTAGNRLGRYELLVEVGESAIGTLYAGRVALGSDRGRLVAVRRVEKGSDHDDATLQALREAANEMVAFQHPRGLPVIEARLGTSLVIASGYSEGEDLRRLAAAARSRHQAFPPAVAARIVFDLATSLIELGSALDDAGLGRALVGIGPDCLAVAPDGRCFVSDLALATLQRPPRHAELMAYRSPEQLGPPGVADERSVVFGLGVLWWEMLANETLFGGGNQAAVWQRVRQAAVTPPASADPAAARALLGALARDPADRSPSLAAFLAALSRGVELAPVSAVAALVEELAGPALAGRREALGGEVASRPPNTLPRPTAEARQPDGARAFPVTAGDAPRPPQPAGVGVAEASNAEALDDGGWELAHEPPIVAPIVAPTGSQASSAEVAVAKGAPVMREPERARVYPRPPPPAAPARSPRALVAEPTRPSRPGPATSATVRGDLHGAVGGKAREPAVPADRVRKGPAPSPREVRPPARVGARDLAHQRGTASREKPRGGGDAEPILVQPLPPRPHVGRAVAIPRSAVSSVASHPEPRPDGDLAEVETAMPVGAVDGGGQPPATGVPGPAPIAVRESSPAPKWETSAPIPAARPSERPPESQRDTVEVGLLGALASDAPSSETGDGDPPAAVGAEPPIPSESLAGTWGSRDSDSSPLDGPGEARSMIEAGVARGREPSASLAGEAATARRRDEEGSSSGIAPSPEQAARPTRRRRFPIALVLGPLSFLAAFVVVSWTMLRYLEVGAGEPAGTANQLVATSAAESSSAEPPREPPARPEGTAVPAASAVLPAPSAVPSLERAVSARATAAPPPRAPRRPRRPEPPPSLPEPPTEPAAPAAPATPPVEAPAAGSISPPPDVSPPSEPEPLMPTPPEGTPYE